MSFFFLFFYAAVFAESLSGDHYSPLGAVEEGDTQKILYRYKLSNSVRISRKVTDHPQRGKGPAIIISLLNESYLAVLVRGEVSFDRNKDGEIQGDERYPMKKKEGVFRALVSLGKPTSTHQYTGHVVFVSTDMRNNLGYIEDMKRKGMLWDGTPFFLHSVAGRFDHPKAKVVLDVDRNGLSDVHHNQYKSLLDGKGVSWKGKRWVPSLSQDGESIRWVRNGTSHVQLGVQAPLLEVQDIRKRLHTLGGVSKKYVVVDFWATWCASCVRDHKKLKKLQKKYDLSILGIAENTSREIRRYTKRKRLSWPQVSLHRYPHLKELYSIDVLPTYALMDKKGRLLFLGNIKGLQQMLSTID